MPFDESPRASTRDSCVPFDETPRASGRDAPGIAIYGFDPFDELLASAEPRTITRRGWDLRPLGSCRNG